MPRSSLSVKYIEKKQTQIITTPLKCTNNSPKRSFKNIVLDLLYFNQKDCKNVTAKVFFNKKLYVQFRDLPSLRNFLHKSGLHGFATLRKTVSIFVFWQFCLQTIFLFTINSVKLNSALHHKKIAGFYLQTSCSLYFILQPSLVHETFVADLQDRGAL